MNEIIFPNPILRSIHQGHHMDEIEGRKAVVDANTNYVYAIVSDNYRLLKHEDAIEKLETTLNDHPELGMYDVDTYFHNEGGKMKRIYTFPDVEVEIEKNDKVSMELHLHNSIDGCWKFAVMLGGFRLVCSNGLVIGKKFLEISSRHYGQFFNYDVEEQLDTALIRFTDQTKLWKKWLDRVTTSQDYEEVIKNLNLGKKAIKHIDEEIAISTGGYPVTRSDADELHKIDSIPLISYWTFYNILTAYITHHVKSLARRAVLQQSLSKIL